MSASATLNGLPLKGVDPFGVRWVLVDVEEWRGPAETNSEFDQNAYADGEWTTEGFYRGKTFTIRGHAIAPSEADADAAIDRLSAAIPKSTSKPLAVSWAGVTTHRFVKQTGKPEMRAVTDVNIDYVIQVRARDARLLSGDGSVPYLLSAVTGLPSSVGGLTVPLTVPFPIGATVTSGSITITSGGETPKCRLTITGPVVNPLVSDQFGAAMRFNLSLDVGQFLVVDLDRRTIRLNDQASRRNTMSGQWIVPRDGTVLRFDAASYNSSAQLKAEWTPARR